MMYTLDASGTTAAAGEALPLWGAAADAATKVFIQMVAVLGGVPSYEALQKV